MFKEDNLSFKRFFCSNDNAKIVKSLLKTSQIYFVLEYNVNMPIYPVARGGYLIEYAMRSNFFSPPMHFRQYKITLFDAGQYCEMKDKLPAPNTELCEA